MCDLLLHRWLYTRDRATARMAECASTDEGSVYMQCATLSAYGLCQSPISDLENSSSRSHAKDVRRRMRPI
jgi:hypothetical protein